MGLKEQNKMVFKNMSITAIQAGSMSLSKPYEKATEL